MSARAGSLRAFEAILAKDLRVELRTLQSVPAMVERAAAREPGAEGRRRGHHDLPVERRDDVRAVLDGLARLRDDGLRIGLSVSGEDQAEVIERAMDVRVDGERLFIGSFNFDPRSIDWPTGSPNNFPA